MEKTEYAIDLKGKSAQEVLDVVTAWQKDDDALTESCCDLIESIKGWLAGQIGGESK